MTKKKYLIILSSFVVVMIAVIILYAIKDKTDKNNEIKHSEEYLYYSEIFNFKIDDSKKYYIIKDINVKHRNDVQIIIPDTIDDIPVKKIVDDINDFANWSFIKILKIGKNVEYIGTSLDDDGILNGGSYGDSFLISSTSQIVEIVVDKNNLVYSSINGILYSKDLKTLIKYPNSKADENTNLNLKIPEGVTEIYKDAFYNNRVLATIELSSTVTKIGDRAFFNCNNLYKIIFNKALESIGIEAFYRCNLASIELNEGVASIGSRAFAQNAELASFYAPISLEKVGENLFSGHRDLLTVTTPIGNKEKLKQFKSFYDPYESSTDPDFKPMLVIKEI